MLDPPSPKDSLVQPIKFPVCANPTLGVELEVLLIDPETRQPAPRAPEVIAKFDGAEWVKPELFRHIVELNTDVCATVGDVRRDMGERLQALRDAAAELGLATTCTGTHPLGSWRDLPITQNERYQNLVEGMRWPARRLFICGMHIHIGMRSGEHAIAMMNALNCFIPHMLALSASSPYWNGLDTGLASCRTKVFENMPTAGLPPRITNWTEFVSLMRTLLSSNAITSIREVWWDIRPHPGFGTVELRMCDGVNTLREVCAMAAFAQCLVKWFSRIYDEGGQLPVLRDWTLKENKWRAARFAEKAMLIRNERGEQIPIGDHLRQWVDHLVPIAEELQCSAELADVVTLLDKGPSYRRQRRVFQTKGSLDAVVDALIEEHRKDHPWDD